MVFAVPLTVLGELLCHGLDYTPFWRTFGLVLTASGTLYTVVTGQNVFSTPASTCLYFLVQMVLYAAVAFLFTISYRLFLSRQKLYS